MRKNLVFSILLFIVFLYGLSNTANAISNVASDLSLSDFNYYDPLGTYYFPNSGEYLATIDGFNDKFDVVEAALGFMNSWISGYESLHPGTYSASAISFDFSSINLTGWDSTDSLGSGDFSINIDPYINADGSGEWATYNPVDPNPPAGFNATPISLYTIKGSQGFAMYFEDPAAYYGTYNIENLRNEFGNGVAALSHFEGFSTGSTPVPEPATMILLGTGLLGIAGFSRRKSRKE